MLGRNKDPEGEGRKKQDAGRSEVVLTDSECGRSPAPSGLTARRPLMLESGRPASPRGGWASADTHLHRQVNLQRSARRSVTGFLRLPTVPAHRRALGHMSPASLWAGSPRAQWPPLGQHVTNREAGLVTRHRTRPWWAAQRPVTRGVSGLASPPRWRCPAPSSGERTVFHR